MVSPHSDAARDVEPVAGLGGLVVDSTVTFREDPKRPHAQQIAFLFPDRARWFLQAPPVRVKDVERPGDRTLRYRRGAMVHRMVPRSGESEVVVGRARDETILQLELRRALFLWPDGFDWRADEGGKRRADLGPWGSLTATPGGTGLPTRMEALTPAGLPLEALEDITWHRDGDHSRPDGFRLVVDNIVVWDESVESVQTRVRFLDAYFTPPDKRTEGAAAEPVNAGPDGRIRPTLLPERVELELPLPPGLGWAGAVAKARDLAAEGQRDIEALGLGLDGGLRLRLDGMGRPDAALLVLNRTLETPPAAWRLRPAGPALSVILANPDALSGRALAGLRAAAVEHLRSRNRTTEAAAGPIYARLDPARPTGGPVQLILPLAPD